jgi:RNA polymerase sigma factor (sigma-70 family)
MPETDDSQLLREFTERQSDAAFAALVTRHVNLVHSVALRQTGDPHAAEEITQAVFIILARKAASLGPKTILSGWLYQTARLTAANFLRGQIRRQQREQEAYMQSLANEAEPDVWPQIAPLLDDALGQLGERDRHAIVLRYFENKSLDEVGAALGASEDAAKMRVNRALEKLRKVFKKRGVTLTAALIANAVAAKSVQAAPVGLAITVAATAAKGVAVGGSTLILVKGALKIMAWTKAKTAIVVTAAVLATGTTTVVVTNLALGRSGTQAQRLADGSLLMLNRVSFIGTNNFSHGSVLEKLLKNSIPTNGVQLAKFKLTRPTAMKFEAPPGKSQFVAELKVIGSNLANHPLVAPAFYREFRCVLRGENGIEYVEDLWAGNFRNYSDGYFGYVIANSFPRDSRWLWLRIEKREDSKRYDLWQKVAEFKVPNPTRPVNHEWVAQPTPATNTAGGMEFVLGNVTVKTIPNYTNDIWNHVVTTPFQVRSNGEALTNWGPAYIRAEDASGNWDYNLRSHRSLDPRFVWKLEADFEPQSGFSPESMATVNLSGQSALRTTNILNVPVQISWDGYWIDVNMPTNRPDLALQFVCVTDEKGNKSVEPSSGSWNRHFFRKGSFMFRDGNAMTMVGKPTTMTFAIVPNIHAVFFAQPRLVPKQ